MALAKELTALQERYSGGQVIFSEEDKTRDLYVLLMGKVEVLQRGIRLAELSQEGTFFGEMALLSGQPRSATLRALKDSILLKVPPDKLPILMKNMPDLAMRMAKNLAATVKNLNKELLKSWEANQLVTMLREEVDQNPTSTVGDTVPRLFEQVQQQRSENMLEVAKSYLRSNVFIGPFSEALNDVLGRFFNQDIEISTDDNNEVPLQEKICGVDFMGATSGTFLFMTAESRMEKIGQKLFASKTTESLVDDTLMEMTRSIIEKVKAAIPGMNLTLSSPQVLENFNLPEGDFLGIKIKTNVGFFCWIHLNH